MNFRFVSPVPLLTFLGPLLEVLDQLLLENGVVLLVGGVDLGVARLVVQGQVVLPSELFQARMALSEDKRYFLTLLGLRKCFHLSGFLPVLAVHGLCDALTRFLIFVR